MLFGRYPFFKFRFKCYIVFPHEFSTSALLAFGAGDNSLLWGLSCAFQGVCSVHGLYTLDASSIPSCDNQKCIQTLSNVDQGKKVENRWYTLSFYQLPHIPKPD